MARTSRPSAAKGTTTWAPSRLAVPARKILSRIGRSNPRARTLRVSIPRLVHEVLDLGPEDLVVWTVDLRRARVEVSKAKKGQKR